MYLSYKLSRQSNLWKYLVSIMEIKALGVAAHLLKKSVSQVLDWPPKINLLIFALRAQLKAKMLYRKYKQYTDCDNFDYFIDFQLLFFVNTKILL